MSERKYSIYGSTEDYNYAARRIYPDAHCDDRLAIDLGYSGYDDIACRCTKQDGNLLKLIATSPHGVVLLKAVKAKRNG